MFTSSLDAVGNIAAECLRVVVVVVDVELESVGARSNHHVARSHRVRTRLIPFDVLVGEFEASEVGDVVTGEFAHIRHVVEVELRTHSPSREVTHNKQCQIVLIVERLRVETVRVQSPTGGVGVEVAVPK